MKISLEQWIKKIPLPATEKWPEGVWDIEPLRHGTMSLILYTPHGKDYQTPHDQDELYIVVKGSGILIREDNEYSFQGGDVLFVAAGEKHHFERFTDDITLWTIFWGPKGGEKE